LTEYFSHNPTHI